MRRNDQPSERLKVMNRIIMRLFAMAETAERAAFALPPVRFIVLWFLQIGEAVGRGYAEDLAGELACCLDLPEPPPSCLHSPEDAINLALHLRWLACLLQVLAGCLAMAEHAGFGVVLPAGVGMAQAIPAQYGPVSMALPARGPPNVVFTSTSFSRWYPAPALLLLSICGLNGVICLAFADASAILALEPQKVRCKQA